MIQVHVPRGMEVQVLSSAPIGFFNMHIKQVKKCPEFLASDGCLLREILHPDREIEKVDFNYSIAYGILKTGAKSIEHKMMSSEVYYILRGEGKIHINNESEKVNAGCVVVVPTGATQFLENTGLQDISFLCIVEPAWQPEDEIIIKEQ